MKRLLLLAVWLVVGLLAMRAEAQEKTGGARKAVPELLNIWGTPPDVMAIYPNELVFLSLPEGIEVGRNERRRPILLRGKDRVDLGSFPAVKRIKFQRSFNIVPAKGMTRFLVVTDMLHGKVGSGLEDFVGIISIAGEVVYKFPVKQRMPSLLVEPVAITPEGTHAEIAIGEKVQGEDSPTIGKPREVLAWTDPGKLERLKVPGNLPNPWDTIMRGYHERKPKK